MKIGDLVKLEKPHDERDPDGGATGIVISKGYPELRPAVWVITWSLPSGEVYTAQEWADKVIVISKGAEQ